jgi:hypothetical protein
MAKNAPIEETELAETATVIDPKARKALFDIYEKQEKAYQAAIANVDDTMVKRSATVAKIIDMCGNGPFKLNGNILVGNQRKKKDGTTVSFFRGPGVSDDIQEV